MCKFLPKIKNNKVGVLYLNGVIKSADTKSSSLSFMNLYQTIEKTFKNKHFKAVALVINSPGGSPVQSELIANKIMQMSKSSGIPVISFAEDYAASGGYWLLCAGEEVYASSCSIIGSIGVIAASFGMENAIKKLGVTRRIYAKGKYKNAFDPFVPVKNEDEHVIKDALQNIYQTFIDYVKIRRKDKISPENNELFSGRYWTGIQAKEIGLIDGINNYEEYMKNRFGSKTKFVFVNKSKPSLYKKIISEVADYFNSFSIM